MKISHTFIAIGSSLLWFAVGAFLFSFGLLLFLKKMDRGYELTVSFLLLSSWFLVHFKGTPLIGKLTHASFARMETSESRSQRIRLMVKEHLFLIPLLWLNSCMKCISLTSLARATIMTTLGLALLYGAYSYFGMRTYAAIRK